MRSSHCFNQLKNAKLYFLFIGPIIDPCDLLLLLLNYSTTQNRAKKFKLLEYFCYAESRFIITIAFSFQFFCLIIGSYLFLKKKMLHKTCIPGLNFSAQNDVRVGLQCEDFLGKCSSKLLRLFGLHWASKGGKMV